MADEQTLIVGRNRETIHRVIDVAPPGSVVVIKPPRRTLDQNSKLWAMLSDISRAKPEGRSLTPDVWKSLFLHALDHAQRFEMALDGNGMVPVGFRSSRLTKEQMSDLLELIAEYGARHDVPWSEPTQGIEARSAETGTGSVHESPVGGADAPKHRSTP